MAPWGDWNSGFVYTDSPTSITNTISGTWSAWNDVTSATITDNVWPQWCFTVGTSSTNVEQVWSGWVTQGNTIMVQGQVLQREFVPRELTAEERAAETERLRIAAEEAKAYQEAARLAVEKAEALLQAHLDEEQQAMLKRESAFLVSVKSGRKYKVKRGQIGNVKELDDKGQEVRSFCIHPADVPDQDAMLAQKLLLEHDEPAFRRIANITELRRAS